MWYDASCGLHSCSTLEQAVVIGKFMHVGGFVIAMGQDLDDVCCATGLAICGLRLRGLCSTVLPSHH